MLDPIERRGGAQALSIRSAHARAELLADGGVLWRPEFRIGADRWVRPLAEAPWSSAEESSEYAALAPTIRRLGGAFLGLPFGGRGLPHGTDLWPARVSHPPHHGVSAASTWRCEEIADNCGSLTLDLQEPHALDHVEQRIVCLEDRPAIEIMISVLARRNIRLPLGYHPILRLPERPHDLRIGAAFRCGHVFPAALNARGFARPTGTFGHLSAVPGRNGPLDLSLLPSGDPSEDLLLMTRLAGPVDASFLDEGYRLRIDWDRTSLPNCLLWIHDRALNEWPWSGSFRGVGVEPGASPFDLALAAHEPLERAGETLAVAFRVGEPRTFRFLLEVALS